MFKLFSVYNISIFINGVNFFTYFSIAIIHIKERWYNIVIRSNLSKVLSVILPYL